MAISLIILDRDGVINKDLGTYVTRPEDFIFIDGALSAIAQLKQAGYMIAIATNQAGIGRGLYSHKDLSAIHARMLQCIRKAGGDIDRIVYCPHYDDSHSWRKPNSGMLTEILTGFGKEPTESLFIGDTVRDMQAGFSTGSGLLMVSGKNEESDFQQLPTEVKSKVAFYKNLLEATQSLIKKGSVYA